MVLHTKFIFLLLLLSLFSAVYSDPFSPPDSGGKSGPGFGKPGMNGKPGTTGSGKPGSVATGKASPLATCNGQSYVVRLQLCCEGQIWEDPHGLYTCCGGLPCLTDVGVSVYQVFKGKYTDGVSHYMGTGTVSSNSDLPSELIKDTSSMSGNVALQNAPVHLPSGTSQIQFSRTPMRGPPYVVYTTGSRDLPPRGGYFLPPAKQLTHVHLIQPQPQQHAQQFQAVNFASLLPPAVQPDVMLIQPAVQAAVQSAVQAVPAQAQPAVQVYHMAAVPPPTANYVAQATPVFASSSVSPSEHDNAKGNDNQPIVVDKQVSPGDGNKDVPELTIRIEAIPSQSGISYNKDDGLSDNLMASQLISAPTYVPLYQDGQPNNFILADVSSADVLSSDTSSDGGGRKDRRQRRGQDQQSRDRDRNRERDDLNMELVRILSNIEPIAASPDEDEEYIAVTAPPASTRLVTKRRRRQTTTRPTRKATTTMTPEFDDLVDVSASDDAGDNAGNQQSDEQNGQIQLLPFWNPHVPPPGETLMPGQQPAQLIRVAPIAFQDPQQGTANGFVQLQPIMSVVDLSTSDDVAAPAQANKVGANTSLLNNAVNELNRRRRRRRYKRRFVVY